MQIGRKPTKVPRPKVPQAQKAPAQASAGKQQEIRQKDVKPQTTGDRQPVSNSHTVQPGESLTDIARTYQPDANEQEVAQLVQDIQAKNADTISGPDLIHPGQEIRLPDSLTGEKQAEKQTGRQGIREMDNDASLRARETSERFKDRFTPETKETPKGTTVFEKGKTEPGPQLEERLQRETQQIVHHQPDGKDSWQRGIAGKDRQTQVKESISQDGEVKVYGKQEKTTYHDGGKEIANSAIHEHPDGTYTKKYEKVDAGGDYYQTSLKSFEDGHTQRDSMTLLKDGTRIDSQEITTPDGTRNISSTKTMPDGSQEITNKVISPEGKTKLQDVTPDDKIPGINRDNLTETDKKVLNTLPLEQIPPGGTTEMRVFANADIAVVLGVEVGAQVSLSVIRDRENPDVYTFGIQPGGKAQVKVSVDEELASGESAGGKGGLAGSIGMELTVDLSKQGEATELAQFAVGLGMQTPVGGVIGSMAGEVFELATGIPAGGNTLEFLNDHLTAVQGDLGSLGSIPLGITQGIALEGEYEKYGKAEGRIEFDRETGGYTITGGVSSGGSLTGRAGVGKVASALVNIGQDEWNMTISGQLTYDPSSNTYAPGAQITLSNELNVGTQGGRAEVTVELDGVLQQLPSDVAEQAKQAVENMDYGKVLELIQQNIADVNLTGSAKLYRTESYEGKGVFDLKEVGVGFGGNIGMELSSERLVLEQDIVFSRDGITTPYEQYESFEDMVKPMIAIDTPMDVETGLPDPLTNNPIID